MKLKHMILGGMAAALLVGCGGHEAETVKPDLTPVQANLVQVQVEQEARPIEVQGFVMPEKETFLSSRAMGPVVKLHVAAGDRVNEGDLLLEIQQDLSHGQLAQAQGGKSQAEAALALAQRNYERFQKLYKKESCSELELDMARMQFEQAKGAVEQASGAVSAAGSVADESQVKAPFDAVVVEKMVNLGDLCAPGRPLVRLQSLTGRKIWLTVRESDVGFVRIGQTLPVYIDSHPGMGELQGRVTEIVPAADMATHTFMVKVDLEADELMSGISGRAVIPGDSRRHLFVPASAVYQAGGLSLVTTVDADGKARTRAVTLGQNDGVRVEVLSGLSDGDLVIRDLKSPVADGTPVQAR